MKGVWGKILRVDLSRNKIGDEAVPDEVYEKFIGGGGLGARILYHEVPANVGAFDPENRLIMATGPFQGCKQTGSAKWQIIARSPLTNINCESALTGWFGYHLKKTGYDAIVFQGRAEKPVYLWATDGTAELRDASYLWGKDSYVTNDTLIKDIGEKDVQVAAIGQAGERLVRIACIGTENKSYAGRGGLGAVMGSKNLKAVAVKGSKEVEFADPGKLDDLTKEINKKVHEIDKKKPYDSRVREHGTAFVCSPFAKKGNLPLKNWRLGDWPEGVEKLGAPRYTEVLNAKPWPCAFCTLQCHRYIEIPTGKYAMKGVGPEYENEAMLGFNLMIDDLEAICYANDLTNRYGMDAISLGAILAWAFECYEKGILTKEDTDGMDLTWGNADALIEMTRKIGKREGKLAWLLGEGVKRASERVGRGSEAWAVQQKGMEIPAHDPRAVFAAGLNYATGAARGPCHERGNPQHTWVADVLLPEFGITGAREEDRWRWENIIAHTATFQDYCEIVNSLVHCKFMVFRGFTLTDLLNTFNAITGLNWTMEEFHQAGERIFNLHRVLNIRYGITKFDDLNFPRRLMKPKDHPQAKVPIGIEEAVKKYYKHRGWNTDGEPTEGKLSNLSLTEIP